ncbi:protein jim lovell-like [Pollicipes pollicipes]|uniref:protein jim lovell-like n=1 Tax=Pollicipes pollicipes TaxID=41117 RepID=UPI001884F604|nr:protein jim lovell-like [Pollicipes pollicipes]
MERDVSTDNIASVMNPGTTGHSTRMMDGQKFCLKWDGFQGSVTSLFDQLRLDGELVDITLCCEGQRVRAHRMMLSACSPYFRELLKDNPCQQMVIFLKDTSAADLRAIIEFMYKGSVNVAQSQLASFIKTAEMLQVQGLSGNDDKVPLQEPIKVEKVDLTLDDDGDAEEAATAEGAALEAALGRVADFEGFEAGSDQSSDALLLSAERLGGSAGGVAGPSQRCSEDGGSQGAVHRCDVCGNVYKYRDSLRHHRKKHLGLTTCPLCGKVCSIVADLRRHLELSHDLTGDQVRRIVPTKSKERPTPAASGQPPPLGEADGW